jgi:C-terminal processing protease CtpA/Prc
MSYHRDTIRDIGRTMCDLVAANYSYLVIRQDEFRSARRMLESAVEHRMTYDRFQCLVVDAFSLLGDRHLCLVNDRGGFASTFAEIGDPNYDRKVAKRYLKSYRNNGPIRTGTLDEIMYIGIDSFQKGAEGSFDQFYSQAPIKYNKFIIDLRANTGGDLKIGDSLVSYMLGSKGPIISSYTRYRTSSKNPKRLSQFTPKYISPNVHAPEKTKQLIVMIGPQTCSSAECIAMDLAAIPGALLVGDTTAGSSGNPRRYLASGPNNGMMVDNGSAPGSFRSRFALDIPSWLNYRLDQRLLEGRGIEPHIHIPASETITQRKDHALEEAINVMKGRGWVG